jgi:peptidoglycan/LPS O-acetylase OafA/YrhL
MSFGELAVDGFFLISGYLITKSFLQSQSATSYLIKRVFRIVPGYLAAFWICVVIVAPLSGAVQPLLSGEVIRSQILLSRLSIPYSKWIDVDDRL